MGSESGSIFFFENTGSKNASSFEKRIGSGNPLDAIDVGTYATPTFADLDGDGDHDALIGNAKGNLSYFSNNGNRTSPSFIQKTGSIDNPFHGFQIGSMAVLTGGASYAGSSKNPSP